MARTAKIETLQSNDGSYDIYPRTVVEALVHKDGSPTQIAETDETGKIAPEYLPEMDYVPNAEKGAANGVATLDDAGRVLSTQLPPMDYDPSGSAESVQEALDAHAGVKVLSSSGVHGFRYNASTTEFEVYNDETGAWESVETGGGGIAPLDVSEISTDYNNGRLYIKWSDPEDTTISGIVVCKWAGTKVVRKAGGYPTSVKDGVLVVDNQVRDQYKDTAFCDSGLANGTTYYYQFFPYSSEGNVNGNTTNRTTGVPNRLTIDSIPVQSGVLTYNKGTQTPSWTGYDPVKMT